MIFQILLKGITKSKVLIFIENVLAHAESISQGLKKF
jgi:hypothetical protein